MTTRVTEMFWEVARSPWLPLVVSLFALALAYWLSRRLGSASDVIRETFDELGPDTRRHTRREPAIGDAIEPERPASAHSTAGEILAPDSSAARQILLVEDNEVNREVATGMLTSLGFSVEIAHDGAQGVARFQEQRWQVVLMDCRMPVMDGFAAVSAIRTLEVIHGWSRVPVIALTANALEGDRERCLAAGMDDFLAKPFALDQLRDTIEKWSGVTAPELPAATTLPAEATLDSKAIAAIRAIPSPDLLERMIRLYHEHTPRLIQEGRAAINAQDCQRLLVAAHELKSASANLGAQRLTRLCRECEYAARREDLETARAMWSQAADEYPVFRAALDSLPAMESAA